MAKSMIKKARTAAQKAAAKKWQLAGSAKRRAKAAKHGFNKLTDRNLRLMDKINKTSVLRLGGGEGLRKLQGKSLKLSVAASTLYQKHKRLSRYK